MDKIGLVVTKAKDYRGKPRTVISETFKPGYPAALAASFIERWGMVAAKPNGEDSAGRQKMALYEPQELVDRACELADIAVETFYERGWLLEIPPVDTDEMVD